jgi:hypothetical protein
VRGAAAKRWVFQKMLHPARGPGREPLLRRKKAPFYGAFLGAL